VSGSITMNGGEITNNSTAASGGGVYAEEFTMSDGKIFGNIATTSGGGVYINRKFTKKGGTIFGYEVGDNKSNVVKDRSGVLQNNKGHAVFMDDSRRRESALAPDDNPDPNKNGLAGGWGY